MDAQGYQGDKTGEDPGDDDDNISLSSESPFPDLGEMWRYGFPRSPDWDSDIYERADDEEVSQYEPSWSLVMSCVSYDSREMERSWVVWALCQTLLLPHVRSFEERTCASF